MDRPLLPLVFTVLVPYGAEMESRWEGPSRSLEWTEPKAWQPVVLPDDDPGLITVA